MPIKNETPTIVNYFDTKGKIYESDVFNTKLAVFKVPGSVSKAVITIPTVASDDEGLPHTLEHLIFIGSEKYPKKFLDPACQIHISTGTNAWTSEDRTEYTVGCCSGEALIKLLYIYMDHILKPRWDIQEFYTEVYHVDTNYTAKGVVYTEMQNLSRDPLEMLLCRKNKALYSPLSPYSYQTGGDPLKIPQLTNEKIMNYHAAMYKWDQVTIVLTLHEDVDEKLLFDMFNFFEVEYGENNVEPFPYVLNNGTNFAPPCGRPLRDGGEVIQMKHPTDAGDEGDVSMTIMSWKGPQYSDLATLDAMEVIGQYLTDDMNGPLYEELVLKHNLCSDVYYEHDSYYETNATLTFYASTPHQENKIVSVVYDVLSDISAKGFDIKRLRSCVANFKISRENDNELSPHTTLQEMVSEWAVMGSNDPGLASTTCRYDYLRESLDISARESRLESLKPAEWKSYLDRVFKDLDCVVLTSNASKSEEEIIQYQKEKIKTTNRALYTPDELEKIQDIISVVPPQPKLEDLLKISPPALKIKSYNMDVISNVTLAEPLPELEHEFRHSSVETIQLRPDVATKLQSFADSFPIPIIFQHVESKSAHMNIILPTNKNMFRSGSTYGITPKSIYTPKSALISKNSLRSFVDHVPIVNKKAVPKEDDDATDSLDTPALEGQLCVFLKNCYFASDLRDGTSYSSVVESLHQISADYFCNVGLGSGDSRGEELPNTLSVGLNCILGYQIQAFDLLIRSVLLMKLTKKNLVSLIDHLYPQLVKDTNEYLVEETADSIVYPLSHVFNCNSNHQQKSLIKKMKKDLRGFVKLLQKVHDKMIGTGPNAGDWTTENSLPKFVIHMASNFNTDDSSLTFLLNALESRVKNCFDQITVTRSPKGLVNSSFGFLRKQVKKQGGRVAHVVKDKTAAWRTPSSLDNDGEKSAPETPRLNDTPELPIEQPSIWVQLQERHDHDLVPYSISKLLKVCSLDPGIRNRNHHEPPTMNIAVACARSSCFHLLQKVRIQQTRDSFHKQRAVLKIICDFLSHGPLFDALRGPGYCYGVSMNLTDSEAMITLDIGPANDMFGCIQEAFKVFKKCLYGEITSTEILVRGRSVSISHEASEHQSIVTAGMDVIRNVLSNRAGNFKAAKIKYLMEVTESDIEATIRMYLPKFLKLSASVEESQIMDGSMCLALIGPAEELGNQVSNLNEIYEKGEIRIMTNCQIRTWLTDGSLKEKLASMSVSIEADSADNTI